MTSEKIKDHYSDDVRLALLEQSINNINNTMLRFEKTFERIEYRFEKIDDRFDKLESKLDKKFDQIEHELKSIRRDIKIDTRWLLTIIGALSAVMAHGFHWF